MSGLTIDNQYKVGRDVKLASIAYIIPVISLKRAFGDGSSATKKSCRWNSDDSAIEDAKARLTLCDSNSVRTSRCRRTLSRSSPIPNTRSTAIVLLMVRFAVDVSDERN